MFHPQPALSAPGERFWGLVSMRNQRRSIFDGFEMLSNGFNKSHNKLFDEITNDSTGGILLSVFRSL